MPVYQSISANGRPLLAYSVEKLCIEKSGDFICDLSGITTIVTRGGSRSRMKIRPDATQNGTIDLCLARQASNKFL